MGSNTEFIKLNEDWNADPNAPCPKIQIEGRKLILNFELNSYVFEKFKEGDLGELIFDDCWRYRIGATDDEGWYRNRCRFSKIAPQWGEFYEVAGDHHFLFYFRDETLECDASGWNLRVIPKISPTPQTNRAKT